MHRMTPLRGLWKRLLAGLAVSLSLGACATADVAVSDPPVIERLRLAITKTRNAIEETRTTIARSQGSVRLPELYVRLAELLSEEARHHNQVAYEREERKSRVIHAPQVQLLKYQAIATYREVLQRFPDSPLGPLARFNIGHELRELGEFDEMVKVLDELVAKHPTSRLAGEALLVLGDYYFDKGDLVTSGAKYAAIVRRGASRVLGLGSYKLAWVHMNQGDCGKALSAFEAALSAAKSWREAVAKRVDSGGDDEAPATAQAIDVGREALVDLVYCYTQERDPLEAQTYLRERAETRAAYVAALRRMADRLGLMDRPDAGLPVARELLRLAPVDQDRLDDARVLYTFLRHELKPNEDPQRPVAAPSKLTDKTDKIDKGPKPAPVGARPARFLFRALDVTMLTESVSRWGQLPGLPEETRKTTREEFERYVRDLLTTAQERTADPAFSEPTRQLAREEVARGYRIYLDAFPEAPERLAMAKNLADVLADGGWHYEAGLAFMAVADGEREPTAHAAALVTAVSELQRSLEARGTRSATGRFLARAALRRAGLALLANTDGAPPLPKDKERAVKFAVALSYFDEGRFSDAIDRFVALAYEAPGTEEGAAAILSALDAHEAQGDFDALIALGQRFVADDSPASGELKAKIKPAIARAEQRKLDELALAAAGAGGGDLAVLERFGERYAGTTLGERALINAFVAARAMGDAASVQRLGQAIVAAYPQSEQVAGIIATMAKGALATLDYEGAVKAFEQAAKAQGNDRLPLLLAAADIEAQLGDFGRAEALLIDALAGAKTSGARNQVAARLAALLEERGAPAADTLRLLGPLVADRDGDVLATYGLAQLESGDGEGAEATFQLVLGGQVEATRDAKARARFGNAEALALLIQRFEPNGTLDGLSELTALVDLVEESYLEAARQGDALLTPMALGRLATVARFASKKLIAAQLPADLAEPDRTVVADGLKLRAKQLDDLANEALTTCANQAWTGKVFNGAVRRCLAGQALTDPRILHDPLKRRSRSGAASLSEPLRQELSDAPDDAVVLMKVGTALLDADDPHIARLVLARAAAQSTGVTGHTHNLLGIAGYRVGAYLEALEAFARAADLGLEAGRDNLRAALAELGLSAAAGEIDKRWPTRGEPGGRPLGGNGPGGVR